MQRKTYYSENMRLIALKPLRGVLHPVKLLEWSIARSHDILSYLSYFGKSVIPNDVQFICHVCTTVAWLAPEPYSCFSANET